MSEEKLIKELGIRIRKARRAADLTQSQLAQIVGAQSPGYICDIEKGRKSLSVYGLFLAEQKLGPLWSKP